MQRVIIFCARLNKFNPISFVHISFSSTPITMAQKSISSFFCTKPEKPLTSEKKRIDTLDLPESPLLKTKKRRVFIESDDSSNSITEIAFPEEITLKKFENDSVGETYTKNELKHQTLSDIGNCASKNSDSTGDSKIKSPNPSPKTKSPKKKRKTPTKIEKTTSKKTAILNTLKSNKSSEITNSNLKTEYSESVKNETASTIFKSSESPTLKVENASPSAKLFSSFFPAKSEPAYILPSKFKSTDDYNPSVEKYNPITDACWKRNEKVPYIAFAKTLMIIENTSSRLKIVSVLANFFRSVAILSPGELHMCINLSINRLGPSYDGLELGIGESLLMKALSLTTGASNEKIKSELLRLGDLGAVAEAVRSRQQTMFKPKPLTLVQVVEKLKEIALMTGNTVQTKKVKIIQTLMVACRECEAKYLIRSLQGKLRIGLAEQSVLAALGQAVALTPFHSVNALLDGDADVTPPDSLLDASSGLVSKNAEAWKTKLDEIVGRVKQAYSQCPNYEQIVTCLMEEGPDTVHLRCCIQPGIPLRPMLAHPTCGVTEVLKRFDQSVFTCEYKYDGERAQIHLLEDSSVRVYSRNQEDNTKKYPDIVHSLVTSVLETAKLTEEVSKLLTQCSEHYAHTPMLSSFIIDSEAVAWDRDAGHILPFQILSTRKRKDVQEEDVKVRVCIYAFDLLYINGVPLTEQPFRLRREILRQVFPNLPGQFMFATSVDTSDTEEIARFMDESVKGNCEGLMVKTLDHAATYEIAKRSRNWLKLKKDYLEGVGDTLDLVVIGGFHGAGKRTGRYGGFLLACYNPDDEEYQTICKIGTGLKDEDLVEHSIFFKDHIIPSAKAYYQYTNSLVPNHWFEPVQVWEVKAADLSISPVHKAAAGMADPEKGLSLRFPRFLRIRDDKKPEDATTARQVYQMFSSQEQIQNTNKQNSCEDDFY